jgi:hypothetical protein
MFLIPANGMDQYGPYNSFQDTAIPPEIEKMCWLDGLTLPHGRGEKENNQTNTQPV